LANEVKYAYRDETAGHHHAYLLPAIGHILDTYKPAVIFDLGCGNGSIGHQLEARAKIVGVDPSPSAVAIANAKYPKLRIELGSAYDDLAARFGRFPMVLSLEVVEHMFDPRHYARTLFDLVEPGGIAIVSTPYHSYLKNVALAVSGKMDGHFTALWDGGHVKFWSIPTLTTLLTEAGFEIVRFERVGRIPVVAKSMIAIARRPA
jgi:2-polyprenyl-3-methyl-5-hydroxy-6-metoxy-1,4-benzoquinol methylase